MGSLLTLAIVLTALTLFGLFLVSLGRLAWAIRRDRERDLRRYDPVRFDSQATAARRRARRAVDLRIIRQEDGRGSKVS